MRYKIKLKNKKDGLSVNNHTVSHSSGFPFNIRANSIYLKQGIWINCEWRFVWKNPRLLLKEFQFVMSLKNGQPMAYTVCHASEPMTSHICYHRNFEFIFRNRFLLTVICCQIYHWLEVSLEVYISRARSVSEILTDDWPTTSDILGNRSLTSKTLSRF